MPDEGRETPDTRIMTRRHPCFIKQSNAQLSQIGAGSIRLDRLNPVQQLLDELLVDARKTGPAAARRDPMVACEAVVPDAACA
jgi:hypothetical protein